MNNRLTLATAAELHQAKRLSPDRYFIEWFRKPVSIDYATLDEAAEAAIEARHGNRVDDGAQYIYSATGERIGELRGPGR